MIRNVIVSKLAEDKLQKLFDYLTEKWSAKVKSDFVEKLDRSIEIIKTHLKASRIRYKTWFT